MSDADPTLRILRDIQPELADMRDDRTVIVSLLNRHDSSIDRMSAALRALRSQFDPFRNEVRECQISVREFQIEIRERLSRIEDAVAAKERS